MTRLSSVVRRRGHGATKLDVKASQVALGSGAGEPLVLGTATTALFNAHTHICSARGSPGGPPTPFMILGSHTSTL